MAFVLWLIDFELLTPKTKSKIVKENGNSAGRASDDGVHVQSPSGWSGDDKGVSL
ncbi:hypothetical protein HPDFL43_18977 [Hoeflea phototrophica DFL-43]|jgi:hypothetical protein|uniref:Uncharacterized protein n=1 Tax=Hoeflea phototrophica (strain DSM 17068 / NCIMB 14078 / DFL-43) TaxID=411684 RepID=A9CV10_HOEPD|nr:hypothetical protein HPDFL43_18977 [Hoeflea phototrophica DFL-43]